MLSTHRDTFPGPLTAPSATSLPDVTTDAHTSIRPARRQSSGSLEVAFLCQLAEHLPLHGHVVQLRFCQPDLELHCLCIGLIFELLEVVPGFPADVLLPVLCVERCQHTLVSVRPWLQGQEQGGSSLTRHQPCRWMNGNPTQPGRQVASCGVRETLLLLLLLLLSSPHPWASASPPSVSPCTVPKLAICALSSLLRRNETEMI